MTFLGKTLRMFYYFRLTTKVLYIYTYKVLYKSKYICTYIIWSVYPNEERVLKNRALVGRLVNSYHLFTKYQNI